MSADFGQTKNKFQATDRTAYTHTKPNRQGDNPSGMMGKTWDAMHMTSFLNKSFYSNTSRELNQTQIFRRSMDKKRQSYGDHFFRNLRHDENTSKIGFTKVNPLLSNNDISKERQNALVDFFTKRSEQSEDKSPNNRYSLRCSPQSKFLYEANSTKFRATDPLTCRNEPAPREKVGFSVERMKQQIKMRYPHGIAGIDCPEHIEPKFYNPSSMKPLKARKVPVSERSFQIDRQWKTKKRVGPKQEEFRLRKTECLRMFRNSNVHGFNIINNTVDQ